MTQVSDHIFLGPVATRRVWGATSTVPSPNAYGIGPAGRLVALDIAPAAVATLASAVTLAGAGTVPLGTGGTQNTTGLTPDQSASCIIFDCERCISIQSANNLSGVHVSATGIDRYGQTLTTGTTGPNNANGRVPRAIVMIPLPAPYMTAKTEANTGPPTISVTTPTGYMRMASRAETRG